MGTPHRTPRRLRLPRLQPHLLATSQQARLIIVLRALRTAHGWSQARLADEINTHHGTTLTREYVARWERGKVAQRGFYLAALPGALDVPLLSLQGRCRGG
ncbi:multiprotein-bridging factor 1 family protein [Streptomyces sp. NPDC090741]|uniref:helix-turn-helix domain-containing protein n=1 Tax=Streptomyces sp. NPDC090741 TaxID=3365967 RepID=UPI0038149ED9